jgi:phage terminase large subunit-like protein
MGQPVRIDAFKHCTAARKYARDVVAGKIAACKWVKLACERQLNDLKRWKGKSSPYWFDKAAAERVCRFIEGLPHIKGEWAKRGELIKLQPWQSFILTTAFGWKRADGSRRFRSVYLEVPRKNAKSTITAGVGLFMLCADGEAGAEIYSAATTRDQARIVFDVAKMMVRREREMREHFGIEPGAHAITVLKSASRFAPLSRDAQTLDGLNIHCALVDELHAHKTREVLDVLETGTGARNQPLEWKITTAGVNRAGICYEVRGYLLKILEGVVQDENVFGIIYTVDDTDDWAQEETWRKANPNYGVSVNPEEIGRLAKKAMHTPSALHPFFTKHLNVWVNAETAWMDMRAWERCADPDLQLEDFAGEPCYIGLDLASKVDIAAKVYLFRRLIEDKTHYYLFLKSYLPEEAAENNKNSQYYGWAQTGRLILTDGVVIDLERIEEEIREDASQFEITDIGYDPFQATQLASNLIAENFPMVEIRPTVLNFSEPMKELEALVLDGRLHHGGDPVLTWMVSNVVCKRDHKDNIYPRKEREENKIDGVVAALMALNRAMAQETEQSIYETEGILRIGIT